MMRRVSLGSRLALLFAACTATVSLGAGLLFSRASEQHFVELDQQLLDSRLSLFRTQLAGVSTADELQARLPALRDELSHQADLALRISASNGATWFESRSGLPHAAQATGLATLHAPGIDYRSLSVPLTQGAMQSPRLTLYLDITHHQHFLQGMQRLIWLTVGLSALITALLGAWAARSGLRPLRQMGQVAASVSARSLTTRLPVAQMPEELAELASSMNAMLQRLDDAFQRLSAFSADIAHELRTPLSNLLTHTQVTLTRPRSLEEYREALHGNLEELQWMAQMINDMLFLAKADHGLLVPGDAPLALHDEVDALLEYYAPLAEDSDVQMLREGEAVLHGDRHMLRRALSNLLDNAMRFTPAGGQIKVTLGPGPTINVANTGLAIDPAALPRLFDRFYRVDPARREGSSEHAGLGLAITRSIVQAHGGCIRAECEGGWTRFVIEFTQDR
ncbi:MULTISPECIES: two-component system sensor histidine kinase CinS [Pseudomonas]|uniref:Sensor protein n=1 Tax=Pseudomonas sp. 13.2 TaxID=3144665 RepID=A0AAU7BJ82_9PSED|nr:MULTISPECIES: two-component system sensor histidine kinase CinS [Pseudomonas]MCX2815589.1 two-component system sensor histidine kinase CinS [Pseudomonas sp. DCB_E]MCX9141938.1 two-component system sensor histidine kinase CinS [Pseudomonas sp. DCB_Q]MDD2011066.1 two-component system sensor histidine kinase CinS [Pseudomonas putida]HDS1779193.1 two-component system sensor histidine kinase CinS [Pseudomonas putida]